MAKSEFTQALDLMLASFRPFMKAAGFRARTHTFNRVTADGLTQVVQFQMGAFDPPGSPPFPGISENLYGRFTVNLGVYVPEVGRYMSGRVPTSFIHEYHCCVRARLGKLGPENADVWWYADANERTWREVQQRIERDGLTFLERFRSRDSILTDIQWWEAGRYSETGGPQRITCAIILAFRGELDPARSLLAEQASEAERKGLLPHAQFVRELAEKLGVGALEGQEPDTEEETS